MTKENRTVKSVLDEMDDWQKRTPKQVEILKDKGTLRGQEEIE